MPRAAMPADPSDVFYLRPLDPPVTPDGALEMGREAGGCFGLHRVEWLHSFLAVDGSRMLCWYRAPDAESARIALRELGADISGVWSGRPLGGVEPRDPALAKVSVLAELSTAGRPADPEALLERVRRDTERLASIACAFLSKRRDRLVCLFCGGTTETIGPALARDGRTSAWPCQVITPPAS